MTSNDETMTSSLDDVDTSISPSRPITQLTSTEPYPGPGLIESATQFVKNWVRQGYNDFMAGDDDGKAGPAVEVDAVAPSTSAEYEAVPPTEQVCTILGQEYCAIRDRDELLKDLESRLWFTYRRGFAPIGGTGPTSDTGWGCMLRCGQMMLAQALVVRHLGRDWRWTKNAAPKGGPYEGLLKLFQDRKDALYSIHQIAQMGQSEGKPVGSWFGPNTVAQVLRRLSLYDDWSSLCVYVAMDNTVVVEDIEQLCTRPIPHPSSTTTHSGEEGGDGSNDDDIDSPLPSLSSIIVGKDLISSLHLQSFFPASSSSAQDRPWHPLLLIIPLRLGLTEMNPMYVEPLKACLSLPQSVGIVGGTPNHAHFFVGHVGDQLFFLDPHTTQPSVDLDEVAAFWEAEEKTMVEDGEEEEGRVAAGTTAKIEEQPDNADASGENAPGRDSQLIPGKTDQPSSSSSSTPLKPNPDADSPAAPPPPPPPAPSILRGDESYHSALPERMKILDLDPSVAVGFFCRHEEDFKQLLRSFQKPPFVVDDDDKQRQAMFEVSQLHPPHWPPFDPYPETSPSSMQGAAASIAEFMMVEADRHYDTDEEFELL